MEQSLEEKLLYAIKKDDLKAFGALSEGVNPGNLRLGRFPVLSLLYLYGARKILSACEAQYLRISSWEPLGEPVCVAELFASKAGKCLRLYFDEIVSPVEMLLILDKTRRVKKAYPVAKPSEAIRKRLKAIYNIKYALGVTYRGNNIVLDRRPLNRRERKRLALACIGCLLILAIIVAVPVTAAELLPNRAAGEVAKLKHIDFSSRNTYTVVRDIIIPDGYAVDVVNCNIKGGGGRLIFGKGATLGRFNGTLSDIEIQTKGSPIFEACTNLANLKNVTVNVDADVEATELSGFVAVQNYGIFDGVRVNAKGQVRAPDDPNVEVDENGDPVTPSAIFGGIVGSNIYARTQTFPVQRVNGVLRNCSANFSNLQLVGKVEVNSSFGGLAGVNTAIIEDCVVSGNIAANTFDVGGACYVNYQTLSRVTIKADLTQTAQDDRWNTVVGGVAIESSGISDDFPEGSVIEYCKNEGNISVNGVGRAYVGGIVAYAYGRVKNCLWDGDINITSATAYAGGIAGEMNSDSAYSAGLAERCVASGRIIADVSEESCVGGIAGAAFKIRVVVYATDIFGNPLLDQDGNNVIDHFYYIGSAVRNCVFVGEKQGNFKYFGNIVGSPSDLLYDENSCYPSENVVNFEGNLYVQNGSTAFGAKNDGNQQTPTFSDANEDKGAQAMSKDNIKASQLYADILAAFEEEQ